RLSKELSTIHTNLEIAFDPDALRHDPPNQDALRTLFTELEFFSLVEELKATAADNAEAVPPAQEAMTAADWQEATAAYLDKEGSGELYAAVLGEEHPIGLAVAGEAETTPVVYADFRRDGMKDVVLASLARWIESPKIRVAGHNLKEVLRLCDTGALCQAALFDAMLVSYLLKPSIHGHSLDELALERLSRKAITAKEAGWDKGQEPAVGDSRLAAYAAERVAFARSMSAAMRKELAAAAGETGLATVYAEIEIPLVPVLVGMEEEGIRLDVDFLKDMSAEVGKELAELEEAIFKQAGERFNLGSPQQLGFILFEKMQLPGFKKTQKTKSYSTNAETLEALASRGYEIAALPALVAPDGRLHTRFNQAVAATGRLSSVNPNLQNIPIRTELGQRIRKAFVAGPGNVLVVADYSQTELRVLAHIADEQALIEALTKGEDVHRATAATVFGIAPELVTAEQRRAAKTINFGIVYGMSAFGLSQALGIPTREADKFITAYLDRYPGVRRYVEETEKSAEKEGKVTTLSGRVRWLPDITSKNRVLRESARRMAINARIQGTAADLLKKAMIAIDRRFRTEHPEARLLLTVHDELVIEAPESQAEPVAKIVKEEMEGVAQLKVPLVVDAGWGPSWYEAKA